MEHEQPDMVERTIGVATRLPVALHRELRTYCIENEVAQQTAIRRAIEWMVTNKRGVTHRAPVPAAGFPDPDTR